MQLQGKNITDDPKFCYFWILIWIRFNTLLIKETMES